MKMKASTKNTSHILAYSYNGDQMNLTHPLMTSYISISLSIDISFGDSYCRFIIQFTTAVCITCRVMNAVQLSCI